MSAQWSLLTDNARGDEHAPGDSLWVQLDALEQAHLVLLLRGELCTLDDVERGPVGGRLVHGPVGLGPDGRDGIAMGRMYGVYRGHGVC